MENKEKIVEIADTYKTKAMEYIETYRERTEMLNVDLLKFDIGSIFSMFKSDIIELHIEKVKEELYGEDEDVIIFDPKLVIGINVEKIGKILDNLAGLRDNVGQLDPINCQLYTLLECAIGNLIILRVFLMNETTKYIK